MMDYKEYFEVDISKPQDVVDAIRKLLAIPDLFPEQYLYGITVMINNGARAKVQSLKSLIKQKDNTIIQLRESNKELKKKVPKAKNPVKPAQAPTPAAPKKKVIVIKKPTV